ncbi:MAG: histidinol dehydrogenase [Flavobacteriales bacterium]|nr:histidinol dehydrogenase [Flavobacteriales bacterium]MCB9363428.1 histidinol dehydrogenase [Flavobacteriales bacterium]
MIVSDLKISKYIEPKNIIWQELLSRPEVKKEDLSQLVKQVFDDVKLNGDEAIVKNTLLFDKVELLDFCVTKEELKRASENVRIELKEAIKVAKANIEKFHSSQLNETQVVETTKGVTCWQESRAIERVGLYIPGGSAPLFSTVLMLAVPAKLAGCKEIVLCTPPNKEGKIADEILYAAELVGVTQIFKVGGIQAIAGLTFGTDTIPRVYKIFGPGNQYVTAAKMEAFGCGVAIDMPAGPSELLVVSDESAIPKFVAADLLSQAEHGADSQVICIATNNVLLEAIEKEVIEQLEQLPRKEIAIQALQNSKFMVISDKEKIVAFVNEYAPEHLILAVEDEEYFCKNTTNAGSVFIGNYTPESAGDYASGTNHTLPTNGFSRSFSGVNMDAFVKKVTFQKITKEGILNLGNTIALMAEAELLQAHKNAVTVRLNELKK